GEETLLIEVTLTVGVALPVPPMVVGPVYVFAPLTMIGAAGALALKFKIPVPPLIGPESVRVVALLTEASRRLTANVLKLKGPLRIKEAPGTVGRKSIPVAPTTISMALVRVIVEGP